MERVRSCHSTSESWGYDARDDMGSSSRMRAWEIMGDGGNGRGGGGGGEGGGRRKSKRNKDMMLKNTRVENWNMGWGGKG